MSDDIPVGPELDRAVALAMGWKIIDTPSALVNKGGFGLHCYRDPRGLHWNFDDVGFSTDPRLQDELLAAIHKETGCVVSIHVDPLTEIAITSGQNARRGDGPTISVALCRLWLAVKGAT